MSNLRAVALIASIPFLVIGLLGCKDDVGAVPSQRDTRQPADPEPPLTGVVEYDVGVVTEDLVYNCVIGGSGIKVVDSVSSNCGCATVGLKKGEPLDLSKPFKVAVSMKGKRAGKGSQAIIVKFEDGTEFQARLNYVYRPLPSLDPQYLILKASEDTERITLVFPGESEVEITAVEIPQSIVYSMPSDLPSQKGEVALDFRIDRSAPNEPKDGVIKIRTSSERRPEFRLPYLILEN